MTRATLRQILALYLRRPPHELRFCYNSFGKPELAGSSNGAQLRFNASHSDGQAVYAVTMGREVGIDIERVRPIPELLQLAERFFSAQELQTLKSLPAHLRTEAFYRCWTRKEAFVKAKGTGLFASLDRFEVSLAPGEPAALLGTKWDEREAGRWMLADLPAGSNYAAALAAQGRDGRLVCRRWPG